MSDRLSALKISMSLIQSEIDHLHEGWMPAMDYQNRSINELLDSIDEHADEIYHTHLSDPTDSVGIGNAVDQIARLVSMVRHKMGLPSARLWKGCA